MSEIPSLGLGSIDIRQLNISGVTIDHDLSFLNPFGNPRPTGTGTISGMVKIKGIAIADATVSIFEEESKTFIETTTTDGTGFYQFNNLSTTHSYFLVVKEPSSEWEYRISSRRIPQ